MKTRTALFASALFAATIVNAQDLAAIDPAARVDEKDREQKTSHTIHLDHHGTLTCVVTLSNGEAILRKARSD